MKKNVMVKPKDRGMSIFVPDGHYVFDAVCLNEREIVVIAKNESKANSFAYGDSR